MALFILLALVGIPLIEIAVFIQVGSEIGLGMTLATTVLTAIAGTVLLRVQGLSTLTHLQKTLERGEMPVRAAFDGVCQLIAGLLLLTPGFVTDFIGLLLFLPLLRRGLLQLIVRRANISVVVCGGTTDKTAARRAYDVDGEYQEVKPAPGPEIEHIKNQGKP
tara:strand:- start:4412 stop:4900 length:489 start_codon:yes stop_codon:yes gene_type:complete